MERWETILMTADVLSLENFKVEEKQLKTFWLITEDSYWRRDDVNNNSVLCVQPVRIWEDGMIQSRWGLFLASLVDILTQV